MNKRNFFILVFVVIFASGGQAEELAGYKLSAFDGEDGDSFGFSSAVCGDTIIVGSPKDTVVKAAEGSAYVFTRSGEEWLLQQKLIVPDNYGGAYFGSSVSVYGDTAVIGAMGNSDGGKDAGAAYIFIRSGEVWKQQAKLTASNTLPYDNFGYSVSIDGDTAVIGAYGDDDRGDSSGAAYIFIRSGEVWKQQAKLTALDAQLGDRFGSSVSIEGDTVVIGAFGAGMTDDNDSAYVFVRSGEIWTQQAKLVATESKAYSRGFGCSVSISGDVAVIGAFWADVLERSAGATYIFVRSFEGGWSLKQKLIPSDSAESDYFGYSVSIDGDTAVIGAYGDDDLGTSSGSAYAFSGLGGVWRQQTKLTAPDGEMKDRFGNSISVSDNTIVVGAYRNGTEEFKTGSAYVYKISPLSSAENWNLW